MNAMSTAMRTAPAKTVLAGRGLRARAVSNGARVVAKASWLPGGTGKLNPTYLDGSIRACPVARPVVRDCNLQLQCPG